MSLPDKIGFHQTLSLPSLSYTAPSPLPIGKLFSKGDMPVPVPHPQAGDFLPAEFQALFNEAVPIQHAYALSVHYIYLLQQLIDI